MKMRKSEHFTRSSSSINGQEFNVKFTDKMFETLFSSLYRYKEAAALRETLCNAIDSHNMRDRLQRVMPSHYAPLTPPLQRFTKYLAPKGTRVIVHLPDDLEPWLEIKDFGIGLTLEQMIGEAIPAKEDEVLIEGNVVVKEDEIPESQAVIGLPAFYGDRLVFCRQDGEIIRSPGLYTTLFNSTKEDDDGQIGAFGLGSKSPFAVSDTFTVESRLDGKLHRYLMYLNARRIPTVDLITKDLETREPKPEDTDEFNGLTVKVPVKNSRFHDFAEELQRLGKVIPRKDRPVVENAPSYFRWEDISYDNRVRNTYIQPQQRGHDRTSIHYAVMGGVSYPIDIDKLDDDTKHIMERFPSSYTFFELGSLNVPPSREDLSYDEFTRETITDEFRLVANSVVDSKLRDLRVASERGPLALYMEKSKISETFGTGFRKMLDSRFPVDPRLSSKEGFVYKIPVEIERNHDFSPPFRSINHPYFLEVSASHYGSPLTNLPLDRLVQWKDNKQRVLVIIEDSIRARNLKIKTAQSEYDVVIVVKPDDNYVSHRNMAKDNPAFKNSEQICEYLASWVGTEETTIDYLLFADKFVEVVSDVLDPADVKFMSELKYVTPPVEKDPGLYPFDSRRFCLEKFKELSADKVSDIINSGKRIVFIEVSGNNPIHRFRDGGVIGENPAEKIRELMKWAKIEDGKNIFEVMNLYGDILLARRKSLPMMKKHPEIFIPVDQILEMFVQRYSNVLEHHQLKYILAVGDNVRRATDRMQYGQSLLLRAGLEKESARYANLLQRQRNLMEMLETEIPKHKRRQMKQTVNNTQISLPERRAFSALTAIMEYLGVNLDTNRLERKVRKAASASKQLFDIGNEVLRKADFTQLTFESTVSKRAKAANRLSLEKYLVVKFLKENYKPSALTANESPEEVLDTISKTIIG